jgi:hypothetical protein
MKNNHVLIAAFSVCSALFFSCTKEPLNNLTQEESRIYVTNRDSSAEFSNYKTFSISDSVDVLDNGQTYKDLTNLDQAYIDAVKKYMEARGYTLVNKNAKPDLGININRIYSTTTGIYDYNDYWDYYGGYWDPYYWGYGGYDYYIPYSFGVYQITEGAVSVDMLDLKHADSKGKIEVIWNGLIRGEGIFNASTAEGSVKALFDQSNYLQSN